MSVVLTLTSAAIIAGISLSSASALVAIDQISDGTFNKDDGIETTFADCEILIKTLNGFDCHYKEVSENEYIVMTNCGNIRYARESAEQAFRMYIGEINDVNGLMENIKSFEVDYGRNVQNYTYHHIKKNLSEGMTIVNEEVLEDDSLYLTINVE